MADTILGDGWLWDSKVVKHDAQPCRHGDQPCDRCGTTLRDKPHTTINGRGKVAALMKPAPMEG